MQGRDGEHLPWRARQEPPLWGLPSRLAAHLHARKYVGSTDVLHYECTFLLVVAHVSAYVVSLRTGTRCEPALQSQTCRGVTA